MNMDQIYVNTTITFVTTWCSIKC